MGLLEDLDQAKLAAAHITPCPLCDYINDQDVYTKAALKEAAGGTIGVNKLAAILRQYDTGIGRRTIERHRREEHTP